MSESRVHPVISRYSFAREVTRLRENRARVFLPPSFFLSLSLRRWFRILCTPPSPWTNFSLVLASRYLIDQPGHHESVESAAPSSASALVPHLSHLISSLKVRR